MAGKIQYELGFKSDSSSLEKIKQELKSIQQMTQAEYLDLNKGLNAAQAAKQLKEIREEAIKLQNALQDSFNTDLGTLNISKFNQELKKLDLNGIYQKFSSLGATGKQAFRDITTQAMTTNLQLKKTHNILEEMKTTMGNTIKWGIASRAMNNLTGSVQKAYSFVKGLDGSLNDIRIVTGKSADEMERFAQTANKAAKNLGASTRDYTDAALIYYQQGLNEEDTAARTNVTVKTANVTKQSTDKVSEQLTAIWNGYKVQSQEAELYIDKVAKVAATTAADLEELSTGMSKVASAASTMGVDFDDLNAMLATVISVTRESPETIGTSFKNIFARMSQLQTTGTDDEGVELTKVTQQMKDMGVEILDENGKLKELSTTIHEVAGKWDEWSTAQQVAAARVMAGTQQYSRFMALMNNQDMWESALEDSRTASGELTKQNDIYLDSMEAHLQKMQAAWEGLYDSLFNTNAFNGVIDSITFIVEQVNSLVDSIGGAGNAFLSIGAIATRVFSKDISQAITTTITNFKNMKDNTASVVAQIDNLKELQTQLQDADSVITHMATIKETVLGLYQQGIVSEEELNQFNTYIQRVNDTANALDLLAEKQKQAQKDAVNIMGENFSESTFDMESITKKATAARQGGKSKKEAYQASGADEAVKELKKQEKGYDDIQKKSKKLFEATKNYNTELSKVDGNVEKIGANYDEMLDYYAEMGDVTTNLINSSFVADDLKKELVSAWDEFDKKITDSGEDFQQVWITDFESNFQTIIEKMKQRTQELQEEYREAGEGANFDAQQNLDNAKKDSQKGLDEKVLQQRMQQYVEEAGAVMQLASAINTVTNLTKIWNDESLSTGEKVKQTFMAIISAGVMLITSLTTLQGGFLATGAAGLVGGTMAALGFDEATISALALESAIWPLLLVLGLIVGVVAGIVVGIQALSDAYNADAIAAEKAANAAQEVADTNDEIQQSLENIKSAFSAYDTAVEKLKQCTEGTQEWKEALQEVNDAAIKAIEAVPEGQDISQLYSRNEKTGQIELNKNNMDTIQQYAELSAASSQLATYTSSTRASMAQISSEMIETTRKMSNSALNMTDALGLVTDGLIGYAVANETEAQIMQDKILDNLDDFASALTLDEFKTKMKKLGMNVDSLSNTQLTTFKDKISKLAISAGNAAEKLNLLTKLKVSDMLGPDYKGGAAGKDITSAQVNAKEKEIYDKIIKNSHEQLSAGSNAGSGYYQELANRLSKATGGRYSAATGNTVTGWDDNRQFIFQDNETGKKTEEMTEAWVASMISAYEAMAQVTEDGEKAAEALLNLDKNLGEGLSNGIRNFISSGNLESLTEAEITELMAMDKQALAKAFGVTIDELDTMLGEHDFNELQNVLKDTETAMTNFVKNYSASVQKVLNGFVNSGKMKDFSVADRKKMGNYLQDVRNTQGVEGLNQVEEALNKLDNIQLNKFMKTLNDIDDWTNMTPEKLKTTFSNMGVQVDLTDEQLQSLINTFAKLEEAASSLEERYAATHDIIDDLKEGDSISKEDYDQLSSAGQEYFQKMMDGTYKLIGQADDLQRTLEKEFMNEASKNYKNMNTKLEQYQSILNEKGELKDISVANVDTSSKNKAQTSVINSQQSKVDTAQSNKNQMDKNAIGNRVVTGIFGAAGVIAAPFTGGGSLLITGAAGAGEFINEAFVAQANEQLENAKNTLSKYQGFFNDFAYTIEDIAKIDDLINNGGFDDETETNLQNMKESINTLNELPKVAKDASEEFAGQMNNALNLLEKSGYDANKISDWQDKWNGVEGSSLSNQDIVNIQNAINSLSDKDIATAIQKQKEEMQEYQKQIAFTATSMKELNEKKAQFEANGNTADNKIWGDAAQQIWEQNRTKDLDTAEVEEYSNYIKEIAKDSKVFADNLGAAAGDENFEEMDQVADNLAIEILNMNKGVEKLSKNWKDWSSILKRSTKESHEYQQALKETKEAVSNLLDIDMSYLSDEFITSAKNMALIEKAAKGDEKAIEELRKASLESVMLKVSFAGDKEVETKFLSYIENLQKIADAADLSIDPTINLGELDGGIDEYINGLNAMIEAGQATSADVNAALSAIGYDPVWSEETVTTKQQIPVTTTHHTVVKKGSTPLQVGTNPDGTPIMGSVESWDDIATTETSYTDEEGMIPVVGLGTEGDPPKIKGNVGTAKTATSKKLNGVSRKANASLNDNSSTNPGGGSKGGGGSDKKPKKEDPLKDESDRYHDINIILKQIETTLNRLQKSKDRLFGGQLVKNLSKQLQVLDKQIDANNKKIAIAKDEASELQGKLANQGVTFNADGTMSNYQAAYRQKLNEYNALVNQYNSLSPEQQETWDENETLKNKKEEFDEFVKDMSRYDEVITDLIPQLEDQISEALYQKIVIKLEAFDVAANIRLDLAQAKKDWEEFEKYVIKRIRDDDILGQMGYSVSHDLSTYFNNSNTGKVQTAQTQVDFYRKRLEGIDPDEDPEEFKATLEKLEEWQNTLMEGLQEYQEAIDAVRELELDFLDEMNEKLEEQLSLYDQIESMVERDLSVFQSVFGDKSSAAAMEYLDKQLDVIEQRASFLEEDVDLWKTEMDNAKARMETAQANMDAYAELYGTESEQYLNAKDEFDQASKVYKESNEKYIDALDKSAENIQKKLEVLSQKMTMQVDIDLEGMERQLLGGQTLDEAEYEWDMAKKKADLYLDSINAIYGVQKLQRKYQTAIDNTSSITAQRKLNALMEDEIKLLEEKDNLTQYDLDRANKKYEIAMKQMELEDQMDNKSTMRLQRDQQGNYSYEFVADQDQIASLQEELSDLKNELYNLDLDEYYASVERMRDFTRDMIEEMRDAALDASLTVEERQAKLEQIYGDYQELMTASAQNGESARVNLVQSSFIELCDFYNNDNEVFQNNLGMKFEGMEEWIEMSNSSIEGFSINETNVWDNMMGANMTALNGLYEHMDQTTMPDILKVWETGLGQMSTELSKEGGFIKLTKTSFDNLTTTVQDYGTAIEETFRDYEEWSQRAQYAAQKTADDNRQITSSLREQIGEINTLTIALNAQVREWQDIADKAKKAAEETYEYIKRLKELEAAKAEAAANEIKRQEEQKQREQQQNQTSQPAPSSGGGGGGTMYTVKSGDTLTGIAAMRGNASRWREILNANAWIDDDSRAKALRSKYGTSDGHWIFPGQQLVLPFDTGGYTGDWGTGGKLALLHEKELVLNKEDTKNLLETIQMIRDISGNLKENLLYELDKMITNSLVSMMTIGTGETLEQQVYIEATFPNVTESHEVEDAINNLINTASQRAGRNKD